MEKQTRRGCGLFPDLAMLHIIADFLKLMIASLHGSHSLLQTLLTYSPSLSASDNDGNTALHYASANGHLKCIRTLLQAGASPTARNTFSWTPVSYSSTVAAEVYFRSLVVELERRRGEEREVRRGVEMGVRVVGREGEDRDTAGTIMGSRSLGSYRNRAESG